MLRRQESVPEGQSIIIFKIFHFITGQKWTFDFSVSFLAFDNLFCIEISLAVVTVPYYPNMVSQGSDKLYWHVTSLAFSDMCPT